jgi:hypothetical protein
MNWILLVIVLIVDNVFIFNVHYIFQTIVTLRRISQRSSLPRPLSRVGGRAEVWMGTRKPNGTELVALPQAMTKRRGGLWILVLLTLCRQSASRTERTAAVSTGRSVMCITK